MGAVVRYALIKAVVERLVGLPERYDIIDDYFWRCLFNEQACHEVSNGFHLCLVHSQTRDFGGPDTQSAWMIPIFRLVSRDQILVRDDVGKRQSLRDFQPASKLAHIGDDLMRGGIAFVRCEDGLPR